MIDTATLRRVGETFMPYLEQKKLVVDAASEIEQLRQILTEARDAWQEQLEADIATCCPGDPPDESQMDETSKPMIEATRELIVRCNAVLGHQQSTTEPK